MHHALLVLDAPDLSIGPRNRFSI